MIIQFLSWEGIRLLFVTYELFFTQLVSNKTQKQQALKLTPHFILYYN